jgi:hypothetical protein
MMLFMWVASCNDEMLHSKNAISTPLFVILHRMMLSLYVNIVSSFIVVMVLVVNPVRGLSQNLLIALLPSAQGANFAPAPPCANPAS